MTLRAAAAGVIDFRDTNLQDPSWWKRWRYLLKAMQQEQKLILQQATFQQLLALVSGTVSRGADLTTITKRVEETYLELVDTLRPWAAQTAEERKVQQAELFKAQWKQTAGFDLEDEEALARWEDELDKLNEDKREGQIAAETAERERQQRYARTIAEIQTRRLNQQGRNR